MCSAPGDDGTRPGNVHDDYRDTSLIFLVDPTTGGTVNPAELPADGEFYLAGVVGNRGDTPGGLYMSPAATPVEGFALVVLENAGARVSVPLPALSKLDVNSTDGTYKVYFLRKGEYDIIGFRLAVRPLFSGLIAAVAASGIDLGGRTPEQWVQDPSVKLSAAVMVRAGSEPLPSLDDTPLTNRRVGQKNLPRFSAGVAVAQDPSAGTAKTKEDARISKSDAGRGVLPPAGTNFFENAHEAVRPLFEGTTPLTTFLGKAGKLTKAERLLLVDQALILFESNYVHLPLKRAMHAIDPVQRLRLLRHRIEQTDESQLPRESLFHNEMTDIFTSTRDLHTNYCSPPRSTGPSPSSRSRPKSISRASRGSICSRAGGRASATRRSGRASRSLTGTACPSTAPSSLTASAKPAVTLRRATRAASTP